MATVFYHPDLYEEFIAPLSRIRKDIPEIILNDFKRYIESDFEELPSYFGVDNLYGSPPDLAGIMGHIHLRIPPNKFPSNVAQAYRKCKKNDPANDIALVYVQGDEDDSKYCILAIVMPNAHSRMKPNLKLIRKLGSYAKEFKENN